MILLEGTLTDDLGLRFLTVFRSETSVKTSEQTFCAYVKNLKQNITDPLLRDHKKETLIQALVCDKVVGEQLCA